MISSIDHRLRVRESLDRVTIQETDFRDRGNVLAYVLGYALGGLRALGLSDVAIRKIVDESLAGPL